MSTTPQEYLEDPPYATGRFLVERLEQRRLAGAMVASVTVLLAIGALFTLRRVSGSASAELRHGPLVLAALVSGSIAFCVRAAWRRTFPRGQREVAGLADQLVGWGSSAALALTALGCSYPGERNIDWLAWLPLLIADQFARQNFFDSGSPGRAGGGSFAPQDPSQCEAPRDSDYIAPHHGAAATATDDRVIQQLFRVRTDEGDEAVYGSVQAEFAVGQRHATVHVGFCPPLIRLPTVVVEAHDRPEVAVKVVQALAHGVRLDLRLSQPAEEACAVVLDLSAIPTVPDATS